MTEEPEPEGAPPLSVGFGVLLAVGLLPAFVLAYGLVVGVRGGESLAARGIAWIVAYSLMFALGARRLAEPPREALGFVAAPARGWLAAGLLLPSILLVSELDNFLAHFFPRPEPSEQPVLEGLLLIEATLVLVAVEPIGRELFFRGLLHRPLIAALGGVRGVLLTAGLSGVPVLIFSGGPRYAVSIACAGLVLGLLRESTRSLLPPLALAVAFGACVVLSALGLFGIPGFDDLSAPHTPLAFLVPAGLSVGVGLRLCQALVAARGPTDLSRVPRS